MKENRVRYIATLSPKLNADFTKLAKDLQITKSSVFQRAIRLLKYAADADEIKIIKNGIEQKILIE